MSITKRGPGQWLVRLRRKGHSFAQTYSTYEEAEREEARVKAEMTGGRYADRRHEQDTPLSVLLERYLEEETPKKKGAKQETNVVKAWLRSDLARLPVASITPRHIAKWRNERVRAGRAPSTISNPMNSLSAVFKTAVTEWGYNLTNPCTGVRRPTPKPPRSAYLTAEHETALLEVCREPGRPAWLLWVVKLAIETAMRQGEIRRVRWEDVHDWGIHLPETKNSEPRDVAVTEAGRRTISEMRHALGHLSAERGGYVFGHPDLPVADGGFTIDQVAYHYVKAMKEAVRRTGMPRLTFHDLRHVAITRLRYVHLDAMDLSKTTGHKTLTVLARYDNEKPENRAAAIRERERALMAKRAGITK
ncbi:hypothetical protein AD931_02635 [Gluconobacter oxydans]|uniref:Integrase n=2 Tax=Gluconobacter oxydans TaxID=442 RepID=A0AB34XN72_GLUOY|nr:site-specific integrase [Gluconobacter oxydans]KXV09780.1 hypothetical protein AD931_02635 [Gluconobacter oxydans]